MHRIGSSFEMLAKSGVRSAERQGKALCVLVAGDQICVAQGELDELWSALSHLVRNAVVHGIEASEERIANGKPPEGRIELRAEIDQTQLLLSVCDDGRGIDWRALGGPPGSEGAPANDNVGLLFREGVTSAGRAGRGLGLSAVHRTVTRLDGRIDVQSQPGKGTTIQIRVPVGDEFYVPASGLSRLPNFRSRTLPGRPSASAAS
jgi:two-component system chemotaxis sensor kinase CheA